MLLGIEYYRERPIFCSLGNFGFDLQHPYVRTESAFFECEVSKNSIGRISLLPVLINNANEPEIAQMDGLGQKVLWMLTHLSEDLNTRITVDEDRIELSAINRINS